MQPDITSLLLREREAWRRKAYKQNETMNEKKTIDQLRYRIKRYHEMGNGPMCQTLNNELRQLLAASK